MWVVLDRCETTQTRGEINTLYKQDPTTDNETHCDIIYKCQCNIEKVALLHQSIILRMTKEKWLTVRY